MGILFGANGEKNIKEIDIGINKELRKVTEGYIGINGEPRLFYKSGWTPNWIQSSSSVSGGGTVCVFCESSDGKTKYFTTGKYQSTDGKSWTSVGTTSTFTKLIYSQKNETIYGISTNNIFEKKISSTSWTQSYSSDSPLGDFFFAEYNGNETIFATVTRSKSVVCKDLDTSNIKNNWQVVSGLLPDTNDWNFTVASPTRNIILNAGSSIDRTLIYSDKNNPLSWKTVTIPARFSSAAYGNEMYAALSGANVYKSNDGLQWDLVATLPINSSTSIHFANGYFVELGYDGQMAYSSDLITWKTADLPSKTYWTAFAYGNDVAVVTSRLGTAAYSDMKV